MFVILLSIGKEYSENGKPLELLESENFLNKAEYETKYFQLKTKINLTVLHVRELQCFHLPK